MIVSRSGKVFTGKFAETALKIGLAKETEVIEPDEDLETKGAEEVIEPKKRTRKRKK